MTRAPAERDIEVLRELDAACRNYLAITGDDWVRPLDCGGSNGSDHSYRLSKLARFQLAEAKVRSRGARGSKLYRINASGRSLIGPPPLPRQRDEPAA